ncbi:MAG: hypothetical protein ACYSUG_06255 [Planctomycetota bacterium]|jgi:hypothetical protein
MEKSKPNNLPQAAAEYIDSVIKHMKYRKKVRADVREELIAHFNDALADCESTEDKQQAAEELIAEFGDEKMLGKLMRRAKKRCRPLWQTAVVRMFQFIGVCFLLLILYIGWFFTGKPQIKVDYFKFINEKVRPVADDSQNAWPYYKQAAERFIKYKNESKDERFDFHPTNTSPFTRSEDDVQVIRKLINDNQETFDFIQQGNQMPYYWRFYKYPEDEDDKWGLIGVPLTYFSEYRNMTYLMCWQALLNAEQGDFEKVFYDIVEAYSFGHHLRGRNTFLVEQLFAIAVESISTDALRVIMSEYKSEIEVSQLDTARQRFAAIIADKDFSFDYDCEKLAIYDDVQRCFTQSRFGKSHLYLPRFTQFRFGESSLYLPQLKWNDEVGFRARYKDLNERSFLVLFTHPDKEQTLRSAERIYAEMEKMADLTPATVKSQELEMNDFTKEVIKRNIFLDRATTLTKKFKLYAHRSRVNSEATLTILAILQYEKEHGELPQSLDALVEKGLLHEVPIDPFSDKPLVYRKTEDSFTLYSVGLNFTDDNGVVTGKDGRSRLRIWDEEGDAVFWPVESVDGPQ